MAIIDDVTINYSIPMPNIANDIADDIARLRSAFTNIDAYLLDKADKSSTYTKSEVETIAATILTATSTTSVAIGMGSKTFTTQENKQFSVGQFVVVSSSANSANFMFGQVTSYNTTTLIVNVLAVGGSGTLESWNISISGIQGLQGNTGETGAQGIQGVAGTNGSTWHSGTSPTRGVDGDYYFRADTSDIYKKVAGSWGSPIANIKGADGTGGGGMPATEPLAITATNAVFLPAFFRILPRDIEVNGVIQAASPTDKWIDSASWGDVRVTSLVFSDLSGVGGNFQPSNMGALTTLSLPALKAVGGGFSPNNMAALTTLSLPVLKNVVGNFTIGTMAALTTLSLPALTNVGANFGIYTIPALTTLSLPALTNVGGGFSPFGMAALTTLSLPALAYIGGGFSLNNMAALTTLSLPALTNVIGSFSPNNMAALTTLSLPALTNVDGNFCPFNMAALTSISFGAIERIGTSVTSGNAFYLTASTANVTTLDIPATLKQVGGAAGDVVLTSCKLNQASVDNLLVRLAALNGTNGTVTFNNRTVSIKGTSSTPSATGLAAKATLVARGCTVTHN